MSTARTAFDTLAPASQALLDNEAPCYLSDQVRKCPTCRQPFSPKKKRQQYCSAACSATTANKANGAKSHAQALATRRKSGEVLGWKARRIKESGATFDTLLADLRDPPDPSAAPITAAINNATAPSAPTCPTATITSAPPAIWPDLPVPDPEPDELRERGHFWQTFAGKALAADARRAEGDGRTTVLGGYGADLHVEHDALYVKYGRTHLAPQQVHEVLHRALHDVRRIVWVDASGSLSLAAVAWCHSEGITLTLLDGAGHLLATLSPEPAADAKLRRAQYTASDAQGARIAREIVRRKLERQHRTMQDHPACQALPGQERAVGALNMALAWLGLSNREMPVDLVMRYEARCAAHYFAALEEMPVRFVKADHRRIPPHWLTLGGRRSPLSPGANSAKRAITPGMAVLNYAYGMLATQCRQALAAEGFDPAAGFLHSDKDRRDSLTWDLMECERGTVDGLALDFISRQTFRAADFSRQGDGSVRLHPQLARAVVAACRVSQSRIDEHARWLRGLLLVDEAHVTGTVERRSNQ